MLLQDPLGLGSIYDARHLGEMDEIAVQVRVSFPGDGHVYSLRTAEYLGRTNIVTLGMRPLDPVILAQVPTGLRG